MSQKDRKKPEDRDRPKKTNYCRTSVTSLLEIWASSWCDNFHFRKLSNVENELYKSRLPCVIPRISIFSLRFIFTLYVLNLWFDWNTSYIYYMVKWPAILCKNISRAETEKNSMGTKTFKFMISTFMNRKYTCNT